MRSRPKRSSANNKNSQSSSLPIKGRNPVRLTTRATLPQKPQRTKPYELRTARAAGHGATRVASTQVQLLILRLFYLYLKYPDKGLRTATFGIIQSRRGGKFMRLKISTQKRPGQLLAALVTFGMLSLNCVAQAATINIVALGASNTAGKGVGASAAWPAQLEGMLRAKGYDVNLTVSGTMGATSEVILSGVDSAVRPGTQVVIFDTGADNDHKRSVPEGTRRANIAEIAGRIRAHGAKSIKVNYQGCARQGDGIHLSAAGHAQVAARLLPQVIAAVGKRH
jgi:acyl-CoA thioesterase-1